MRYPLIICSHGRILIAPSGWFGGIGSLNLPARRLRMNVNRLGTAALSWLLDADGLFYSLNWLALEPRTLAQLLGLSRRVEVYEILEPRSISNGELVQLTLGLTEQFAEAPNSADLRKAAQAQSAESVVTAAQLRAYLGSENAA